MDEQGERRAVLHRQIDLRLPVALVRSEAGEQRIAQRLVPRPSGERDVLEAGQIVTEDGQRAVVGRAQRAIGGECQHAGRQVGEHALQIHPRRLDRGPATVGCRTRIFELARHLVEGLRQHTELVARGQRLARTEIALGDRLRAFGEDQQGCDQAPRDDEGRCHRTQQGQQHGERQRQGVDALEADAPEDQLLVLPIGLLHRLGIASESLGHGLGQLQQVRLPRQGAHRDGHDHPDHQPAIGLGLDGVQAQCLPRLTQLVRRRKIGQQHAGRIHRAGNDLPVDTDHRGAGDPGLLAQAVEQGRLHRILALERERHAFGLLMHLANEEIERLLPKRDAAFERRIHAHVEPRLDAAHDELQRYRIHDNARQQAHQREHQHQTVFQTGAELALAILAPQGAQLHRHQSRQADDHRAVECEQVRIAAGEQIRVRARRREQE